MQGMTEVEWQQKIQKNCRQVRDVRGGCECQQGPITRHCTFRGCPRRP